MTFCCKFYRLVTLRAMVYSDNNMCYCLPSLQCNPHNNYRKCRHCWQRQHSVYCDFYRNVTICVLWSTMNSMFMWHSVYCGPPWILQSLISSIAAIQWPQKSQTILNVCVCTCIHRILSNYMDVIRKNKLLNAAKLLALLEWYESMQQSSLYQNPS